MSSISSYIPLVLGIIAGSLFILVLLFSFIFTMRNRKKIQRYAKTRKTNS